MFLLNHDQCSCTLLLIIADSIFELVTLFRVGSGGAIVLDGRCAVGLQCMFSVFHQQMWTDSDIPEGIGVATCAAAGLAA